MAKGRKRDAKDPAHKNTLNPPIPRRKPQAEARDPLYRPRRPYARRRQSLARSVVPLAVGQRGVAGGEGVRGDQDLGTVEPPHVRGTRPHITGVGEGALYGGHRDAQRRRQRRDAIR